MLRPSRLSYESVISAAIRQAFILGPAKIANQ
jgi:hypothetical protein